jgi:hypothetical protein
MILRSDDFMLCKNPSDANPRSLSEIEVVIKNQKWETKSADKSPWGIISRFACTVCGDEFVAMLTSSRKTSSTNLEVSVKNVILG